MEKWEHYDEVGDSFYVAMSLAEISI